MKHVLAAVLILFLLAPMPAQKRPYCYMSGAKCFCPGKDSDTPYRVPRIVCELRR